MTSPTMIINAPEYQLHLTPEPTMENTNRKDVLEGVRIELLQQLQDLQGAPSVAMHQVPPPFRRQHHQQQQQDGEGELSTSATTTTATAAATSPQKNDSDHQRETRSSGEHTRKPHAAEFYDKVD